MELGEQLNAVNIGEPTQAGGLKVFPLYPLYPPVLELALLADAVEHNDATISEDAHAEGPWYRKVVIDNRADVALLVRDGDLLLGGMQDRTAERTCIVPACTRITVPALCVEQQRSEYAGREDFEVSRTSADPHLRSSRIAASVRAQPLQEITWRMVATRRRAASMAGEGGSLRDVHERGSATDGVELRLPPVHLASGVAIAWAGDRGAPSLHVELFASPAACSRAWAGLVRAARQCVRGNAKAPRVSRTELRKVFGDAGRAQDEVAPDVGVGQLRRAGFRNGVATLLSLDGRLAHASLFAA